MPPPDEADSRLRPRPVSRPRGTNKPHGSRPGGTNKPHGSRPGGTNKPHGSVPGEPDEFTNGIEDDRLTTNWIQYTQRLKPGYSVGRYTAWLETWKVRRERGGKLWKSVGPNNIGGRITCLAPTVLEGSDTLLAGAACGGLWRKKVDTADAERAHQAWGSIDDRWPPDETKLADDEANQQAELVRRMHNIGALAVDPNDSKVVYCGTGHAYNAGDSFPGVGLFRSTDGGDKWERVASADTVDSDPAPPAHKADTIDNGLASTGHQADTVDSSPAPTKHILDIPHRISAIAVDPQPLKGNDDYKTRIRIGGVEVSIGAEEEDGSQPSGGIRPGMYYWDDGEAGWHRDDFKLDPGFAARIGASAQQAKGVLVGRDYQCHSIIHCRDENSNAMMMTAISGVLDWSGIWRSKDNAATRERFWERLTRGLPPGREFGRTSLAVSKLAKKDSRQQQPLQGAASTDAASTQAEPPQEQARVVYAFIGSADGQCLGVFRTSDGGEHWSSFGPDHFVACGRLNYTNCIAVHPENPDLVVCGADDIHRSTDGGQTWTQVTEWFAAPNSPGYAHKDHHALLWVKREQHTDEDQNYRLYSGNDGGISSSDDDGVTWQNEGDGLSNLMFYDIDVAPSSTAATGLIIAGGTQDNASLMTEIEASGVGYIPTELGVQLTQLGVKMNPWDQIKSALMAEIVADDDRKWVQNTAYSELIGSELYVRVPNLESKERLEGTYKSLVGVIIDRLSLPVNKVVYELSNGTKDPGVLVQVDAPSRGVEPIVQAKSSAPAANQPTPFADMLYGDGGWIVFDPKTPLHLYGSSQFMTIYRHRIDDGWVEVTPPDATDDERGNTWMAYIAMHPEKSNVVFTGSTRLWRTQNDGEDWKAVTDHLDGGAISAIEISDAKPSVIYIGTEKGNIFKSTDAGNRWSQQDGDPGPTPLEWRRDLRLPAAASSSITRIEADPNNAEIVFASLLGFDSLGKYRYPHVIWRDKTNPWKDAGAPKSDGTHQLPNVHHNVVTWSGDPNKTDPNTSDLLARCVFVGNDVGVWVGKEDSSQPGGWKWLDISGNLPNVIVTDLVYHRESRSLTAATYGRGIWRLTVKDLEEFIKRAT